MIVCLAVVLGCTEKGILRNIGDHEKSCIFVQILPAVLPILEENKRMKEQLQFEFKQMEEQKLQPLIDENLKINHRMLELSEKLQSLQEIVYSQATDTCINCNSLFRVLDNGSGKCALFIHKVRIIFVVLLFF